MSPLEAPKFSRNRVAGLFNRMASEYDRLDDELYSHILRQIEQVLRRHFPAGGGRRALDVGCGTGFQTLLLESLGWSTTGVDIAADLLNCTRGKLGQAGLPCRLGIADARGLPFPDATFDLVNCCGSTLSFIDDYSRALREMTRVLRPGGSLVVEVEQRWNLDLIWALLDSLAGGPLGYEQGVGEALSNLTRSWSGGIVIDYPYTRLDGTVEHLPLRCFSPRELRRSCRSLGLETVHSYGIHSITNLLPSPWLGDPGLRPALRRIARRLARVEEDWMGTWPMDRLGGTLMLVLNKRAGSSPERQ